MWYYGIPRDGIVSITQKSVHLCYPMKKDVFILLFLHYWIISFLFFGCLPLYLWVLFPDLFWNLVNLFRWHCSLCRLTRRACSRSVPNHMVWTMAAHEAGQANLTIIQYLAIFTRSMHLYSTWMQQMTYLDLDLSFLFSGAGASAILRSLLAIPPSPAPPTGILL